MIKDRDWLIQELENNSQITYGETELEQEFNKGVWYAISLVKEMEAGRKPIVPKYVSWWLESSDKPTDLVQLFKEVNEATVDDTFVPSKFPFSPELYDWLKEEPNAFYILADAMRYGYQIEKEKYFRLYIDAPVLDNKEKLYLNRSIYYDDYFLGGNQNTSTTKAIFSEYELKNINGTGFRQELYLGDDI